MEKTIYYKIDSASNVTYSLEEKPESYSPGDECEITMNLSFKVAKEQNKFHLTPEVNYFDKKSKQHLMLFRVEIVFSVQDIQSAFASPDPEVVNIPDGFFLEAIQLTLGIVRGMMALKNIGTYLEPIFLPVYNVAEIIDNLKSKKELKNA